MPEPTFAQSERRSFLLPAVFALILFAFGFFVWKHIFFPPSSVDIVHLKTEIVPIVTTFHTDTILVGANETNSTLLVVSTIRIENKRNIALSLDAFSMTLTDSTGAELVEKAVTRQDLPNLKTMFPQIVPKLGKPLEPDTEIQPGQSAEGTLLFSFPVTEAIWTGRKSASIEAVLYHQPSIQIAVPQ